MKKHLIAVLFWLFATPAFAGVPCTLPFNLTNGTTADATQVMANYNALVTCLGNAAHAGNNSDITALLGLTTPLSPAQGGSVVLTGGSSGGTPNAQTVTTLPASTLQVGSVVTFTAGLTNTGAMTLAINTGAAIPVFRQSQLGVTSTAGGEVIAGYRVVLQYDGTQFQCMSCGVYTVGQFKDYGGAGTPPAGYLFADGSCQLQATYADLYAVVGTYYGSCSAGSFALPDARSNLMPAIAQQGNNGTTARLNTCGTQTTLGGLCGSQQGFISQANLPSVNFNVAIPANQWTHNHSTSTSFVDFSQATSGATSPSFLANAGVTSNSVTSSVSNPLLTGTAASGGSGSAIQTIPPMQFITKIIKF